MAKYVADAPLAIRPLRAFACSQVPGFRGDDEAKWNE
jgi:hypothetical protein